MRSLPVLVVGAAALVAVVIIVNSYFGRSGPMMGAMSGGGPAMLAGAPAQSFPAKRLDGVTDALENYRGKVVLVNLWASWCAPCRSETPALEQLYRENASRGFVVLGIDQGESLNVARDFANSLKLTYPILVDEDQHYGRAYAAVGLPTSLLVDRSGHIVRGIDGEQTLAEFRGLIGPTLKAQ